MQGKHKNMMSEQVLQGGENYFNMLLECFNVFLATDGKRCLICALCARRLRDASDFKVLVMRAQSGLRDAAKRPASLPSKGLIIKLGPQDSPELCDPATETVSAKTESTLLPAAQCSKSSGMPLTTETVAKIKPTLLPAAQRPKLGLLTTAINTVSAKIKPILLPAPQRPKSGLLTTAIDTVSAKIKSPLLLAAQCPKSSFSPLATTDTVSAKIKPTLLPAAQCSKSSFSPLASTDTVSAKIKPTLLPAAQCSKSSFSPLATTDTVSAKIKPTLLPAEQCSKSSFSPLASTDTVSAKIKPTLLPAAQCSKSSQAVLTATDLVVVKKEPGVDIATHEITGTATLQNKAGTLEAPGPRDPTEPVSVKIEPGIDIVEHELTGPQPKKPRLVDTSSNMDTILANLFSNCPELPVKQEIHSDQDPFLCIVNKFREEYYKSPQYEEEDKSVYEMPEKDLIDLDHESVLLDTGCGCKLSCVDRFERNDVLKSRLDCLEQDYYCYHNINHLNLMMLGAISATVRLENERAHCVFWFRGAPVCKKFFLYAHALSNTKYEKILRCFKVSGVESLTHGNKMPLMTKQQRADVTTFINNFAKQNALVLPGRSTNNTDLYILPSSMSRTSIYEIYVKACRRNNTYPVIRPLWYQSWDSFCSNVTISPPSHPCITCQNHATDISEPQTENDKKKSLKKALEHLNDVEIQRDYYQNMITEITPSVMNMSLSKNAPCSFDGTMHYSFDYLQQIHLPHNPDQTGPQDFLDSYKVSLFGVAIEPLNKFVLYVIPENVQRGINLVISLLHSFFINFALGETRVVCHASNQNKNNILIQYAAWRVLSGLHKSFQLSFLPSGHDNFAPDIYFGLIKSKFRKSIANSLIDICEIADNAVSSGIITVVLVASETGESYIRNYDWKELFKSVNAPSIPEIHNYPHFKTDCQTSGSVMCSKSPEEFTTQVTLFDLFQSKMPNIIKPQLSIERRKYLYYNIRKFVTTEYQDVLCPLPSGIEDQENTDSNQTSSKVDDQCPMVEINPNVQDVQKDEETCVKDNRKASACSYCGVRGHKNEIRQGVYVCPKRQLDSSKVGNQSMIAIDPNVQNVQKNEETCVKDNRKDSACSYCGGRGHKNEIRQGVYVCPKRQLDSSKVDDNDDQSMIVIDPNIQNVQKDEETCAKDNRKASACSYCGVRGHKNEIRQGVYVCPKRQIDSSKVGNQSMIAIDPNVQNVQKNEETCVKDNRKDSACSYCGGRGHMNEIRQGVYVCPKRQIDSSKVDDQSMIVIDPNVQNVQKNEETCVKDNRKDSACSYCGGRGHKNEIRQGVYVCPKRQLDSSKVDDNDDQSMIVIDPNIQNVQKDEETCAKDNRKASACSYCGVSGHKNEIRQGVYVCPKRQIDSSKVDDQSMIVIDPNVQNVEKEKETCARYNRKASACLYCGVRGHKNEIRQGVYVCPKRQQDAGETVKKCEYCIPKDVYNSVLDPDLLEVYMENCGHCEKPDVNLLNILDQKGVKTSSGGKKRPVCSYCGLPGHRNLVKHGIYFCKQRAKDREESLK